VGSRFSYKLTEYQTIALDLGVTRLGSSITGSPLVGKRFVPEVRAAYVYRFK
jgi:outer membrane protein